MRCRLPWAFMEGCRRHCPGMEGFSPLGACFTLGRDVFKAEMEKQGFTASHT